MATDNNNQLQKVTRVAQANRRRLMLFSIRPQPPRGVIYDPNGYVAWEEPSETRNVTHYNVYAGDDQTLYRRYPVGTKIMQDLTPDKVLIWVSAYNEESGMESIKVKAGSQQIDSFDQFYTPPPPAAAANNVTGFTVSNERINADQGGQMVRIYGSWTLPASNYTGARVVGKVAGDPAWTVLATVGKTDTSFKGPYMPAPRVNTTWTVDVQPINDDGVMSAIGGSTPTASTTIAAGVAGYDLKQVLAGSYDSVDFGFDGSGNFKVLNVNLTKAFNYDPSQFDPGAGAFKIKALDAGKIATGTLKVGGTGIAGKVSVVDSDNVTQIAWIGYDGGAYRGGWFKNLWIGGSDPATAIISAVGTSVTMKGVEVKIGPGGGGTGQIWLYDASTIVGWMGANVDGGVGYTGAWFSNLWIGGSGPGSAKIVATGGSVTIDNIPVYVTGTNFRTDLNVQSGAGVGSTYGLSVCSYNVGGTSYTHPEYVTQVWDKGIYIGGRLGNPVGNGPYPAVSVYAETNGGVVEVWDCSIAGFPNKEGSFESSGAGGLLNLYSFGHQNISLNGSSGNVYFTGTLCTNNYTAGGLSYGAAPGHKIAVYDSDGGTLIGYIPII